MARLGDDGSAARSGGCQRSLRRGNNRQHGRVKRPLRVIVQCRSWDSRLVAEIKRNLRVYLRAEDHVLDAHSIASVAGAHPWALGEGGNAYLVEADNITPHAGCRDGRRGGGTARKARLCPPYHSIRAGRAVDAIGRADPNKSAFANHVLRSRCAGREYDGTSPRSTRFSVGTGSSWDAEYNLCVVQLVTSVGSFWSCPVFIAHQLSASGFSSLAGSEAVDGPAAMRLSRCRGDNFFLSWRFLCST